MDGQDQVPRGRGKSKNNQPEGRSDGDSQRKPKKLWKKQKLKKKQQQQQQQEGLSLPPATQQQQHQQLQHANLQQPQQSTFSSTPQSLPLPTQFSFPRPTFQTPVPIPPIQQQHRYHHHQQQQQQQQRQQHLQPRQQPQQKQTREAPTKSKSWKKPKKPKTQQDAEKGGHPRKYSLYFQKGKFDFKVINALSSSEVQSVLDKQSGGLKKIANSDNEEDEGLQQICLLRALVLACEAGKSAGLTKILSAIKGSKFLCHHLPNILREIYQQQEERSVDEQAETKQVITDMISLYQTFLRCLPSAYADLPLDEVQRYLKKISIQGKSEMEQKLDALKKERDEYIRDMRTKNVKPCKQATTNKKPPNDFRELQICPTVQELASDEKPFLRANVKKGSYEGVEHYLDVQFRLYREDFITPLRDGIKEIVKKIPRAERDQNIKTYEKVKITKKQYSRNGIIYTLQFDVSKFKTTRWDSSRRLIFGSFLCLSKDNFANILFATVANRDPKDLAKGFLDVSFVEGQNVHGIELRKADQYVMAESPAYFEAYRHVLAALQNLREGSLPFQKYLVECSKDVDAPAYLRDKEEPVRYDLREALDVSHKKATHVAVLQPDQWPDVSHLPLNDSQYEALRTALTKEFSVIQGPPGTGKTYVGLKIARCLLNNSHAWNPTQDSPILMVCFTNHALDQFLEGILDFLPKGIIRVGSRCKSERLEKCNLKSKVDIARAQRDDNRLKLEKQQRRIESTKTAFEDLERHDEISELKSLEDSCCITKQHLDNLFFSNLYDDECRSLQDVFESWLCNKSNTRVKVDHTHVTPEFKPDCQVPSRMQPEKDEVQNDEDQTLDDDQGWGEADFYRGGINDTGEDSGSSEASDETDDADDNSGVQNMPRTPSEDEKCQEDLGQGSQVKTVQTSEDTDNLTDTNRVSYQDALVNSLVTPQDWEETEGDDRGWTEVKRKNKSVSKALKESTATDGMENLESQGDAKQQTKVPDGLGSNADGGSEETLETIDIQEELLHFEHSRFLVGDEDLFLPITTEMNSSDHDDKRVQQTEKETLDTSTKNTKQKDVVSNTPEIFDPSRSSDALADQSSLMKLEKEKQMECNKGEASAANSLDSDQNKRKKEKTEGMKNENTRNKVTPKELLETKKRMKSLTKMKEEEMENIDDIWDLSHDERLRLYLTWIDLLYEYYRQRIIQEEQAYDGVCKEIDNKRMVVEEEILKKAKVIGMTTTGAARYHSVLQRIKPRIVIIEEAAEVLEAHIITSLARDTEQVILIGDHKQLRPKPTMYNLAIKYNLEISLFERMVLNKMDCKMLSIQHRMRPEIAQLTKRIYEEQIDDHLTVSEFEDVRGMKTNLFFLDHREEESFHGGLQSYSNKHEADMMVALCRYLLQQDYKPSQITILTMYTGQLLAFKDKMPRKEFYGVRVTVVDNFQGEENDIILLSLVRSNKHESIGFLKESNRICVALSRARKGFYCIGNFDLLSRDRLWKEICEELKTKEALSDTIPLACINHGTVTSVRKPNDFVNVPSGGCGLRCDVRLPCGHRCQQKCHGTDPKHSRVRCQRACSTLCPEGKHRCQERCHHPDECEPCPFLVPKVFPGCGHEDMVACWLDPKTQLCDHPEKKTLACGHQTSVPCFLDPMKNLKTQYCEIQHESSTPHTFGQSKDQKANENKEKMQRVDGKERILQNWKLYESTLKCEEKCHSLCKRGLHFCEMTCHYGQKCASCKEPFESEIPRCGHRVQASCATNFEALDCQELCRRLLKCGHPCKERCIIDCSTYKCQVKCPNKCENDHPCSDTCHFGRPCSPCKQIIEKVLPNCNHSTSSECHVDASTIPCLMPCERTRSCGHPCNKKCNEPCNTAKCEKRQLKTLSCGHHRKILACYVDPSQYPCKEEVDKQLPCGHHVQMQCHADPSQYHCKEEVDKQLPCGHLVQMQCHADPSQYPCKEEVDKQLTCGHHVQMQCHADPSQYPCKEEVDKQLPCGHHVQMQCHADPSQYPCKEEVDKQLPCGHHVQMQCHADPSQYPCKEEVDKQLPCGHLVQMQCHADPSQYPCKEEVDKQLSCGHQIQMPCNMDASQYLCKEEVTKELPCHHKIHMPCNKDPSKYLCKEKVDKALPCGHNIQTQCHVDPTQLKHPCKEKVMKELPCGHQIQMPCNMDASQYLCKEEVPKQLTCGHEIKMACNKNPLKGKCTTFVERKLLCGHVTRMQCGSDMTKHSCKELIIKMLSCGHEVIVPCDKDLSKHVCKEPVLTKLQCGHEIQILCHADPSMHSCTITEDIKLPCGHIQKRACHLNKTTQPICSEQVKKTLDCGHEHVMQCHLDPSQHICTEQVEKTLACGHKKQMPCSKDIAQITCTEYVIKKLSCGHDYQMLCNSNPSDFQCKVPVWRELNCGHMKEILCSTSLDTTSVVCDEIVEKELPCQHIAKAECFKELKNIVCEVLVARELPCKHATNVPCHETFAKHKCQEVVLKTLPCNHVKQMACHENSKDPKVQCNTVVTKILECGHEVDAPCNMDVDTISCEKHTENVTNINPIAYEQVTEKQPTNDKDDQIFSNSDMVTFLANKQTRDDFLQIKTTSLSGGDEVKSPHGNDASAIPCKDGTKKQTSTEDQVNVPNNAEVAISLSDQHMTPKDFHQITTNTSSSEDDAKAPHGDDASAIPCKDGTKKQTSTEGQVNVPNNAEVAISLSDQHMTPKDFHQITTNTSSSEDDAKAPHGDDDSNVSFEVYTKELPSIDGEGEIPSKADALTLSPDKHTAANDLNHGQNLVTPFDEKLFHDKHTKHFQASQIPQKSDNVNVNNILHDKQVMKQLPCGHEYLMSYKDDASKSVCFRQIRKELPCGHEVEESCNDDASTTFCVVPTRKRLQCGHMKELTCITDIASVTCKTPVLKKLPCGHETELPCNVDVNTILCVEPTRKMLQCGHMKELPCNTEMGAVSCNTLVVKKLPCNHEVELPCNADVNTILCLEQTRKMLKCGHMKELPCTTDITTVVCKTLVVKKLPCNHEVELPCNADVNTIICVVPTRKLLQCGHMKELPCNTDMAAVSCNTLVVKKLPCNHEVELPCNADVNTIICVVPTKKLLQCGHMKELPCNTDMTAVPCNRLVVKKLQCDHEIELPCHKTQEEQICQRQCERLLPCNHQCKQKCSEKCDQKLCTEATSKKVPCPNKHKISVPCNVKVQANYVCDEEVTKLLTCGHLWKGECCKSNLPFRCEIIESRVLACPGKHQLKLPCYVDVRKIPCNEKCPKTLPCGHPCQLYCDEPCSPRRCKERVSKTFKECGHKKWLPCGIFPTAICLYDCLRPLESCGHPCQGRCGKPCNTRKPCLYEILKTLPCGHKLKMKCCDPEEYVRCPFTCTVKLDCGHICTGNCSTCQEEGKHEPCPLPCGRTLWCSHRCHQYCSETCRPCFRECRGWCPHGRCQRRCYETCEPCTMPCANTCPHSKCNNLCHEMCDRELCKQPCYKMLACGHPCIGMCRETCPTLCYVCTPAKVAAVSPNKQRNKELRFIQIQECGHVIEVKRMDAWMQEPVDTVTNGQAQPRRCPECSVPIYFSFRYSNFVREALQRMFESESFRKALETWKAQPLHRLRSLPHHNRKTVFPRRGRR